MGVRLPLHRFFTVPTSGVIVVRTRLTRGRVISPAAEPVANRPLSAHVVDALAAAGTERIALVGPALALEPLRADGDFPDVEQISCPPDDDVHAMLVRAREFVGDTPCLVHDGAGLAGQDLTPMRECVRMDAPDMALFLHHDRGGRAPLARELGQLLRVSNLHPGRHGLSLAGVAMFGAGGYELATAAGGGDPTALQLAAVDRLAAAGGRVHVGRLCSWRCYGGKPRELLELNRLVLDRLLPGDVHEDGENRIDGRVRIDPTATVEGSVISGPAVIGPRARVLNAYVGPYSSIGPDVLIEGAEIECSIVSEGACIENVGVRIEGSTIGPWAHIRREFTLPRAMRMHVGRGMELMLA